MEVYSIGKAFPFEAAWKVVLRDSIMINFTLNIKSPRIVLDKFQLFLIGSTDMFSLKVNISLTVEKISVKYLPSLKITYGENVLNTWLGLTSQPHRDVPGDLWVDHWQKAVVNIRWLTLSSR